MVIKQPVTGIVVTLVVVALGVVVWRYLNAQPHGKNKDRREFADALLFLLRMMDNGGRLQAQVVDEKMTLHFERVSGDDRSAVISLEVEGVVDSERLDEINAIHEGSEEPEFQTTSSKDRGRSGHWEILDIWDDSCVAPIVHRAWRLLDDLEVAQIARIDFSLHGPRSSRWTRKLRSQN